MVSRKQLLLVYHYEVINETDSTTDRIGRYLFFLAMPDDLLTGVVGLVLANSTGAETV